MSDTNEPSELAREGDVAATLGWLRAELEGADDPGRQATLLFELGVLEDAIGDEAAAARDLLGAINADGDFREPLERLIVIIGRRKSYKNLGKLLERLTSLGDSPAETARALVEYAAFLTDHGEDSSAAATALEQAVTEAPDDAAAWLALEALAGHRGDGAMRVRALAARAAGVDHPEWKALLLTTLAELKLAAGEVDEAVASAQQAVELKGAATFRALQTLERVAASADREDVLAQALEARAALLLRATSDAPTGDAFGVPRRARTEGHAADAFLRAAETHRRRGDVATAITRLDHALERLPTAQPLVKARLHAAQASGDTAKAAELARRELEGGVTGPAAASLWIRIAEAAAAAGDAAEALASLGQALTADPGCLPARALELDLLSGGAAPQDLATSLEAAAAELGTEDAKARYYVLAADAWARLASDASGAKAALSQAGMYGLPGPELARVGRHLAALTNDGAWYEESTRRLLAAGAPEAEQPGLWFELGRARLLRGDRAGAAEAFASLAKAPGGAWLGQALGAYALDLGGGDATSAAGAAGLASLADVETDDAVARALRVVVAFRHAGAGSKEEAVAVLRSLHDAEPGDLLVASALAHALRGVDDAAAAAVLAASAAASADDDLAASHLIESGLLRWRAGDRSGALEAFDTASTRAPEATRTLLGWALRAADPNGIEARRRALDAVTDDGGVGSLERFTLDFATDSGDADAALERARSGDVARDAATLAGALWSREGATDSRAVALEEVAARGAGAQALALGARHGQNLAALGETGDLDGVLASAAAWAAADEGLESALEWIGASIAVTDPEQEVLARRRLAARLGGRQGAAISSSAALIALAGGDESQSLASGNDPETLLTNLELAQPGCDPRRRAYALSSVGSALGDDSASAVTALAGWNALLAGDAATAARLFGSFVEAHPTDVVGWDGLRAAAEALGDRTTVAEACAALGDTVAEDERGAALWEAAAVILLDELGDTARGTLALERAVGRDIHRFDAFDRLFRLVRSRKDGPRLLELIDKRLAVAEDPVEIAKLFWERARVLREAGDREGAMTALENVTMLEPDHVGALALSGEIYITLGKLPEAAENLARLSELDDAPVKQRLMSGVAAVDIFEKKLGQPQRALGVLAGLHDAGLSTPPVRERLAKTAALVEDWERATSILEELMNERETPEGRAEAARFAMVIHRDRRADAGRAVAAVQRLLTEIPDDGEALDLVLSGALAVDLARPLLRRGREVTVAGIARNPLDEVRIGRLAHIAAYIEDAPLRQATLGALVAVGHGTASIDDELRTLDERVARTPQIAIDEERIPDLCHPEDRGPLADMMRALAPTFAETLGPGLEAFGVSKRERVKPSAGLAVRNEIAAWAGALGLGEFELYVGGPRPDAVFGIPGEVPSLVIGASVGSPLTPVARQLVARELFAIRRGTSILRHRDPSDIAALVVASCKLGGFEVPSPAYAMLGEFERQLGKGISRKVRKLLPQLAEPVARSQPDPLAWVRAAVASLDRLAAIAAGDVSHVLSAIEGTPRGQLGASNESQERARRLLAFALSPTYLALREQLGMGVR